MNAYLNQVIQTFQHGRLGAFVTQEPTESEKMAQRVREYFREMSDEDDAIRYLHEEYETVLRECVYCDRLIEAGPDWGDYCEECYWALRDEGRD